MNALQVIGVFMMAVPFAAMVIMALLFDPKDKLGCLEATNRHPFAAMLVITALGAILFFIGAAQPKEQTYIERMLEQR